MIWKPTHTFRELFLMSQSHRAEYAMYIIYFYFGEIFGVLLSAVFGRLASQKWLMAGKLK